MKLYNICNNIICDTININDKLRVAFDIGPFKKGQIVNVINTSLLWFNGMKYLRVDNEGSIGSVVMVEDYGKNRNIFEPV